MYRSPGMRTVTQAIRNVGQYTFETGTDGYSLVQQLYARAQDSDPSSSLYTFYTHFRIIGIKYEFKRYSNVGFSLTADTTRFRNQYQAAGYAIPSEAGIAPVLTVANVPSVTYVEEPKPGTETDTTTTTGGSDLLPTLYWCEPMAAGVVPTDTRQMVMVWPKVHKKEFGSSRKLQLNVIPWVYERKEVNHNLVASTTSFNYKSDRVTRRRSPWWLAQIGGGNQATEGSPGAIAHGMTYIGCRGAQGSYQFEVTKTVLIQYRGHVTAPPSVIEQNIGPAV